MYYTQVYAVAEPDEPIATFHWKPVPLAGGVITTNRAEDANLCAAAPDLLAACEDLLAQIEAATRRTGLPLVNPEQGLAAIAKATGQAG